MHLSVQQMASLPVSVLGIGIIRCQSIGHWVLGAQLGIVLTLILLAFLATILAISRVTRYPCLSIIVYQRSLMLVLYTRTAHALAACHCCCLACHAPECYCDAAGGSYRSVIYYTTHNRHWQGL